MILPKEEGFFCLDLDLYNGGGFPNVTFVSQVAVHKKSLRNMGDFHLRGIREDA
jgi:hypothetical protein